MKKRCDNLEISSASEILERLGFKKNSPQGTKKAFLKHLIAEANRNSALSVGPERADAKAEQKEHNQLSFFDSKKLA